jgi:aspartyl/asparaginyl beta-hydroxylase (cupin superfamily)
MKTADPRGIRPTLRRWRRNVSFYNSTALINPLFGLYTGGSRRTVFYDIDKVAPALRAVDDAFEIVRAELDAILAAYDRLPPYHSIDTDVIHSSGRTQRDKRWSIFMLACFGKIPAATPVLAPKTLTLVQQVPGFYQAMFSILEPGKNVRAHVGPSRAYLRYHLGLYVPTDRPPRIRVKDQYYTWKEGESVLFDDSRNHEVINDSDQMRAVLIIDLARPMPFPLAIIEKGMKAAAAIHYAPRVVGAMNALVPPPP